MLFKILLNEYYMYKDVEEELKSNNIEYTYTRHININTGLMIRDVDKIILDKNVSILYLNKEIILNSIGFIETYEEIDDGLYIYLIKTENNGIKYELEYSFEDKVLRIYKIETYMDADNNVSSLRG